MKRTIELIEAGSDLGAGTHGACFGTEALQMMAHKDNSNLFQKLPRRICQTHPANGHHSQYARNIEAVYKICRSIAHEVRNSLDLGNFPVVISGDHSCAAGTIAGIKIAKPQSRLGVVWIDAHADLHSPFTTPSGNMHGMPLAASINADNQAQGKQEIDTQTRLYWEKLKNMGNLSPKILPQDIVYVSLRDFEKEEASLISAYGIKTISTETIRRCGMREAVKTILRQLDYCTDIYVSFDADCLDASVSIGTGLPVDGGLMPLEAELLITLLMENRKACCLEFTELNPFLDKDGETTTIIYQLLKKSMIALSNKAVAENVRFQDA